MKEIIRKKVLEQRRALEKKDFWARNNGILAQVEKFDWSNYRCVHMFLPIRENNEVDTFEILSFFKKNFPQLEIVIPRTNFVTLEMDSIAYDHDLTILQKNKFRIPEPVFGKKVSSENVDVVLVPLLAFDHGGERIGYGGGFYDRFLINCRPDCLRIGLSIFECREEVFLADKYDVPLTHCFTPTKTHEFKNS